MTAATLGPRGLLAGIRPHRFEVASVAVFAVAALGFSTALAIRLVTWGIPWGCFGSGDPFLACRTPRPAIDAYLDVALAWGWVALAGIVVMPAIAGLTFGVAIVGKELDRGTTTFDWALAPSRPRWLLARVLPLGLVVLVASTAAGLLGDWLEFLRSPGVDPFGSFEHLGTRGFVVGAEGLAYFGIALLVGAVVGRLLPALLLSVALAIGLFVGVTLLTDAMLHGETVLVPGQDGGVPGRVVDFRIQTPVGVMSWMDAHLIYGDEVDLALDGQGFRTILAVNPPEMYPLVVARESVVYGAVGLLAIVATFAVVDRRRP